MKKLLLILIFLSSNSVFSQSSVKEEMEYVLAMEMVFGGMSYLATQDKFYGPVITECFALFMGLAGLENASLKELGIQSTPYIT